MLNTKMQLERDLINLISIQKYVCVWVYLCVCLKVQYQNNQSL
jgi:hypothetical protein